MLEVSALSFHRWALLRNVETPCTMSGVPSIGAPVSEAQRAQPLVAICLQVRHRGIAVLPASWRESLIDDHIRALLSAKAALLGDVQSALATKSICCAQV